MEIIKKISLPQEREIAKLIIGDNCEPVVEGHYYDLSLGDAVAGAEAVASILEAKKDFTSLRVRSEFFSNFGLWNEAGAGYVNVFGKLVHAVMFFGSVGSAEVADATFAEYLSQSATERIGKLLGEGAEAVEVWAHCASSFFNGETTAADGSGRIQAAVLERLLELPEGDWAAHSSLFPGDGWIETREEATKFVASKSK